MGSRAKENSQQAETFTGRGALKCYGQIDVIASKWETVEGSLSCRPKFGPASAPQGFIADGEDGSHWVVVDDKGTADCIGEITYTTGDLGLGYCSYLKVMGAETPETRMFCGYATCAGFIDLVCDGMLSGCHG